MRDINEIIIHCSASDSKFYDFEAIKKDHMAPVSEGGRGWSHSGYQAGINYDAEIILGEPMRPIEWRGAHCRGRNSRSIGICVLGWKSLRSMTTPAALKQMESLAKLLNFLMPIWDLTLDDVNPHNMYSNKECPAFNLDWFKETYMEK